MPVTQQEIDQGFVSGQESPMTAFLRANAGQFSSPQEAISAATAAGIRVGFGDLNTLFTRQSSSAPAPFEQLNPSANMGAPQQIQPTPQVVAPQQIQPTATSGQTSALTPIAASQPGGLVQGSQSVSPQGGVPPTGLIGAESAIGSGLQAALGQFGSAEQALRGGLEGSLQGVQAAQDFTSEGRSLALRQLAGGFNPALTQARGQTEQGISALQQGGQAGAAASQAAIDQLNAAQQDVGGLFEQGIQPIQQFVAPGQQSQQVQAALSGALGPQAQAQAFANFTDSPGQEFLRERGERALTRNASATGGLGGGRVLQELQRQGIGLAQQDFANQFDRLGQVTGQGQQAAGQVGQLRGQQAGIFGQLGGARSDVLQQQGLNAIGTGRDILAARQGLGGQLADINIGRGVAGADVVTGAGRQLGAGALTGADLAFRTGGQLAQNRFGVGGTLLGVGGQLAQGRTRAGEQIAGAALGTGTALASMANQLGAGTASVLGAGGGNLANLLSGTGAAQSGSQSQLATLLANLATQQGSTVAGLPGIPGIQETKGIIGGIGQAAGGAGGLIAALSDIRLKENIRPAGVSDGGHNLYTWDWNDKGLAIAASQPGFGVLAQEVQETLPSAVIRGPDGYLRVDYSRIH